MLYPTSHCVACNGMHYLVEVNEQLRLHSLLGTNNLEPSERQEILLVLRDLTLAKNCEQAIAARQIDFQANEIKRWEEKDECLSEALEGVEEILEEEISILQQKLSAVQLEKAAEKAQMQAEEARMRATLEAQIAYLQSKLDTAEREVTIHRVAAEKAHISEARLVRVREDMSAELTVLREHVRSQAIMRTPFSQPLALRSAVTAGRKLVCTPCYTLNKDCDGEANCSECSKSKMKCKFRRCRRYREQMLGRKPNGCVSSNCNNVHEERGYGFDDAIREDAEKKS
ncbi:hypothetical protein BU16DRAFT_621941 [Lophium mytilinum]|uniref:Zn(2)-C6 fungal-type domain-containing protein n=1 Tax=Lophium mytilinum TaxID=390894 RepID=A0A6A6QDE9_9PEZI|nr:hypothetical protein BU16DRAFT_621941 [Lophium mytilinum]